MNESIEKKVVEIVAEYLKLGLTDISRDSLRSDLEQWDSLTHLLMMMAIEKEFGLSLSSDDIAQIQSVNDLYYKILDYRN